MEAIHFVHLSDTHLNHNGKETFLKANVLENFERTIDCISNMTEKMAFLVITGDIMHEGDQKDYLFLKSLLERSAQKLGAPIFLALGNHDNRQYFFEGYVNADSKDAYYASHYIHGLRLIMLDSKVGAHEISGKISADQLAWLKDELSRPAQQGTILAFHHPPLLGSFMPGEHCLSNAEALYEVIGGTDVIGILTGHTHSTNQCILDNNILSATAGSTAFSFSLSGEDVCMVDRCEFNTCVVQNKKMHVSNTRLTNEQILATFSLQQMASMSKEFNPQEYNVKGA